jgi:hypothetical protein
MSPGSEYRVPARVNKYQVIRLIGGGGGGVVYEALHPELQRRVALKLLHPSQTNSPEAVKRFLREGEAAARIDHPHVVDIADVGLHRGQPFLVMELLKGQDLRSYLDCRAGLPLTEALDLIGVAKLMDESRGRTSWTGSELVMGTLSYMAPEQARGLPLDGRVDQYALGLILHECLTGKRVRAGEDQADLIEAIVEGNIAPPSASVPGLPPAFEAALMRALHRDPEQRFPTTHDFGCALLPFASQRLRTIWNMVFEPRRSTRLLAAGNGPAEGLPRHAAVLPATVPLAKVAAAPGQRERWTFAQETRSPRRRRRLRKLMTFGTLVAMAAAGMATAMSLHQGGLGVALQVTPSTARADAARPEPAPRPAAAGQAPAEWPPAPAEPGDPMAAAAPADDDPTAGRAIVLPPSEPKLVTARARRRARVQPVRPHTWRPPGYRLGANQSPIITD